MIFKYLVIFSCCLALELSVAQNTNCVDPYVQVDGIDGICYYFSPYGGPYATWIKAREACLRIGGLLAIIDTEDKNIYITDYLVDHEEVLGLDNKWIGLTDKQAYGTWIWDGINEVATYTNFDSGEPGDSKRQNCVVTSFDFPSKWMNRPCEDVEYYNLQYICQQVVVNSTRSCQSPFVSLGSGCYLFYSREVTNWVTAHNYCNGAGSSLLSIDSEEENSYITDHISNNYADRIFWIGGYDEAHEGKWYWDNSGYEMNYTNWANGQPDGGKEENCAITDKSGYWEDEACSLDAVSGNHCFICEILA